MLHRFLKLFQTQILLMGFGQPCINLQIQMFCQLGNVAFFLTSCSINVSSAHAIMARFTRISGIADGKQQIHQRFPRTDSCLSEHDLFLFKCPFKLKRHKYLLIPKVKAFLGKDIVKHVTNPIVQFFVKILFFC